MSPIVTLLNASRQTDISKETADESVVVISREMIQYLPKRPMHFASCTMTSKSTSVLCTPPDLPNLPGSPDPTAIRQKRQQPPCTYCILHFQHARMGPRVEQSTTPEVWCSLFVHEIFGYEFSRACDLPHTDIVATPMSWSLSGSSLLASTTAKGDRYPAVLSLNQRYLFSRTFSDQSRNEF